MHLSGRDIIGRGAGDDIIDGGDGTDSFLFRFNSVPAGWGSDQIIAEPGDRAGQHLTRERGVLRYS